MLNSWNGHDTLSDSEIDDLRRAKALLESPGLAARVANVIGMPVERGFKQLPEGWQKKVSDATQAALLKGLEYSISSLGKKDVRKTQDWMHKLVVSASGAIGGAFGLLSLPIELPLSTCIILRSVADIAKSEEHDLSRLDVRLSCLEVLALGGRSTKDDSAESGYWAVRIAVAKLITEATAYLAEKGVAAKTPPVLLRLVASIASRFGTVVSEEIAAKAIPVVGGALGATVNFMFMDHFQRMAHGHFIVLRLENRFGSEAVKTMYEQMGV